VDAPPAHAGFTFGQPLLAQGIDFLPVAMGLFGISEVLVTAEEPEENVSLQTVKFRELWPTVVEWRRSFWPMIRGSFIGFFIGIVSGLTGLGGGALLLIVEPEYLEFTSDTIHNCYNCKKKHN
jgi:putative tricarboxylic transport membrane protein